MLDIRDFSICDAFPFGYQDLSFLTVACGECRLERFMVEKGLDVHATDIYVPEGKIEAFSVMDVFDPDRIADVVICSEMLEHVFGWELAYKQLIEIANTRVIITVPYKKSFYSEEHVNFFDDDNKFVELGRPYSVSVSKIRTKPRDVNMQQYCLLVIVDKKQKYNSYKE